MLGLLSKKSHEVWEWRKRDNEVMLHGLHAEGKLGEFLRDFPDPHLLASCSGHCYDMNEKEYFRLAKMIRDHTKKTGVVDLIKTVMNDYYPVPVWVPGWAEGKTR